MLPSPRNSSHHPPCSVGSSQHLPQSSGRPCLLPLPRPFLAACIAILSFGLIIWGYCLAKTDFLLDIAILDAAEKKFGTEARKRLLLWQELIRANDRLNEREKLEKVNNFFNPLTFVSDAVHWGKKDYWATPVEFMASDGGDCEDFALAKYFTLKLLGIPEEKMALTYVKAWEINQAHMVLTYYPSPSAVPLVLDNLKKNIEPATNRPDLLPVYSFNASSLWLAKERGRGNLVGSSERLQLWNDLMARMPDALK